MKLCLFKNVLNGIIMFVPMLLLVCVAGVVCPQYAGSAGCRFFFMFYLGRGLFAIARLWMICVIAFTVSMHVTYDISAPEPGFCLAGYTKGNNIFRGRDRKRIRENGSEEGVVLKCMFGYEVLFVAVGLVSVFIPDKWVLLWCVGVSVVFLMLSVFFYKGFAKRIETKDF